MLALVSPPVEGQLWQTDSKACIISNGCPGAVLGGVLDLVLVTSVMNEEREQGGNLPPLDTLSAPYSGFLHLNSSVPSNLVM